MVLVVYFYVLFLIDSLMVLELILFNSLWKWFGVIEWLRKKFNIWFVWVLEIGVIYVV